MFFLFLNCYLKLYLNYYDGGHVNIVDGKICGINSFFLNNGYIIIKGIFSLFLLSTYNNFFNNY